MTDSILPADAAARARDGDTAAWAALAARFTPFIRREAGGWARRVGSSVRAEDLVQEGHLGLRRAIDTYVAARGDFTQHAMAWIRKFVSAAAQREVKSASVTVHLDGAAAALPASLVTSSNIVELLARRQLAAQATVAVRAAARTITEKAAVEHVVGMASVRDAAKLAGVTAPAVHKAESVVVARAKAALSRQNRTVFLNLGRKP